MHSFGSFDRRSKKMLNPLKADVYVFLGELSNLNDESGRYYKSSYVESLEHDLEEDGEVMFWNDHFSPECLTGSTEKNILKSIQEKAGDNLCLMVRPGSMSLEKLRSLFDGRLRNLCLDTVEAHVFQDEEKRDRKIVVFHVLYWLSDDL